MGLFGNSDEQDEANKIANEQIQQNQAELESKRANLYSAKLDIIRGQGAENWSPDRTSGASLGTPPIETSNIDNSLLKKGLQAYNKQNQGYPAT